MVKEESIKASGVVSDTLPNTIFKVKLEEIDSEITAHLCGKMRKNFIRVSIGDEVDVEISPYDLKKGRIVKRK